MSARRKILSLILSCLFLALLFQPLCAAVPEGLLDRAMKEVASVDDSATKELYALSSEDKQAAAEGFKPYLSSDIPKVRARALNLLGELRRDAALMEPDIVECFTYHDRQVRYHAVAALVKIGATRRSVPALANVLQEQDSEMRCITCEALGKIGPGAQEAIPALIDVLTTDMNYTARSRATEALGKIGMASNEVVSALALSMEDINMNSRIDAARALSSIRPFTRKGVETFLKYYKDPNEEVRRFSTEYLTTAGPEYRSLILPVYKNALKTESDLHVRVRTIFGILILDPAQNAVEHIPLLKEGLKNSKADVRNVSVRCLGMMGPSAKGAVRDIIPLLSDGDVNVRGEAFNAVERIHADTPELRAALEKPSRTRTRTSAGARRRS
jgi:HEAT repeat protein